MNKALNVNDINNFAWYLTKKDVLKKVKELQEQGIIVYYGGKNAKSKQVYHDIKIAAIYHNQWDGSNQPWVVAW